MTDDGDDQSLIVERLVREYVDRCSTQFDSAGLTQRVLLQAASSESDAPRAGALPSVSHRRPVWRRWLHLAGWGSLSLLALMVAFFAGRSLPFQTANAATVLRDVQSEHSRGVDFCYRVRFDPDPRYRNESNPLDGPSLSHLWTRGDRFWSDCEIGKIRFKVGREAAGTIWISPSPRKGIRFSNEFEKLPEVVAQICQINSMSVPRLMNEVLVDFDLSSRIVTDSTGEERTVIWAQLKPGRNHPLLSHALLEIDPQTNILVRLVLWTVQDGAPKGTVAFTLLERATLGDEQYELRSHLTPGAIIEEQMLPPPDYTLDLPESG